MPSDWTIDTLKEMLDERYATQTKALDAAFAAQQVSGQTALVAINDRLRLLNELRAGVATSAELEALEKVVQALTSRVDTSEAMHVGAQSKVANIRGTIAAYVATATFFIGVIVFVANIMTKGG
jgi:hypothetical protein